MAKAECVMDTDRAHCHHDGYWWNNQVRKGEIRLLGDNSVYDTDEHDDGPSTWGILHLDFAQEWDDVERWHWTSGVRKGHVSDYLVPLTALMSPGSAASELRRT